MSTDRDESSRPFYKDVDGMRIPGMFDTEVYRSALRYKPVPGDVFIVTYPKCGTTWVQNIVTCIFRAGKPFASAAEFMTQTPFLECTGAEGVRGMKRPAAMKLHQPFHTAPWSKDAKYIFVARNPKDCLVSFYYHTKNIPIYRFEDGDFNEYFELFINGEVDFGDYFDTLLSWYEHRNEPNVLFMTYEQLKKDTPTNVLKIAEFMGEQYKAALVNDEKFFQDVILHSSVDFMKKTLSKYYTEMCSMPKEEILNHPDLPQSLKELFCSGLGNNKDSSNEFQLVRKGVVGDWRNHFTPEQSRRLDEKFKQRTKGTDIPELWKDDM